MSGESVPVSERLRVMSSRPIGSRRLRKRSPVGPLHVDCRIVSMTEIKAGGLLATVRLLERCAESWSSYNRLMARERWSGHGSRLPRIGVRMALAVRLFPSWSWPVNASERRQPSRRFRRTMEWRCTSGYAWATRRCGRHLLILLIGRAALIRTRSGCSVRLDQTTQATRVSARSNACLW